MKQHQPKNKTTEKKCIEELSILLGGQHSQSEIDFPIEQT